MNNENDTNTATRREVQRELIRDASEWFDMSGGKPSGLTALKKLYKSSPHVDEVDILVLWQDLAQQAKEAKKKAISKKRSKAGKKGGRPGAPPEEQTARQFVARQMTDEHEFITFRHYRDVWYSFSEDGWHPETDGEMQKRYMTYAQNTPELAPYAKRTYAGNVLANAASYNLCGIGGSVEKPCWLSTGKDARNVIAFSNGVSVDVWLYANAIAEGVEPDEADPCFGGVSPDLFSGDFVNYPFEPSQMPEKFLNYLERVQPTKDGQEAVQRMLGLLLADTGKFEVFWQLYGIGANGKTVLLDIINELVGFRNVSNVPLEALAPGTRFQSFPLITSKVNICGELSTDVGSTHLAKIEGQFKHCVSGGVIEYERKGVDKEQGRCRARFVMSSNSLPSFVDTSDAIWRRLRIIPFPVQIPQDERNPDLAREIIADELPAICAWALDGLADVISMGYVPDSPEGLKMKEEHRGACDHEKAFIDDHGYISGEHDDWISSKDLYDEYKEYMLDNGYRPKGMGRFETRLKQMFPKLRRGVTRIQDNLELSQLSQKRVFFGVKKEVLHL